MGVALNINQFTIYKRMKFYWILSVHINSFQNQIRDTNETRFLFIIFNKEDQLRQ